jgi:hypothetical protein
MLMGCELQEVAITQEYAFLFKTAKQRQITLRKEK